MIFNKLEEDVIDLDFSQRFLFTKFLGGRDYLVYISTLRGITVPGTQSNTQIF